VDVRVVFLEKVDDRVVFLEPVDDQVVLLVQVADQGKVAGLVDNLDSVNKVDLEESLDLRVAPEWLDLRVALE